MNQFFWVGKQKTGFNFDSVPASCKNIAQKNKMEIYHFHVGVEHGGQPWVSHLEMKCDEANFPNTHIHLGLQIK